MIVHPCWGLHSPHMGDRPAPCQGLLRLLLLQMKLLNVADMPCEDLDMAN